MITINLEGQDAVFAKFKDIDANLKTQVVGRLADAVLKDVERGADRHTKTGALFRSIRMRSVQGGYVIEHDLQHAPHAIFVHWGTRPHDIKPKNKKALRWPSGGNFVFAKFVKHPGYQGDPYFVRAAADAPRHFNDIIRQMRL